MSDSPTMRAAVQVAYGEPRAALRVTDVPRPRPGPGDALVRVRSATLNRKDLFALAGLEGPGIRPRPPLPHVGGPDGWGTIVETGSPDDADAVGTRVFVYGGVFCGACEWCRLGESSACERYSVIGEQTWGCLAEHVVAPMRSLVALPPEISDERAHAVNDSWITAWHALVRAAAIRAGETVLVTGASGGVGTGAIRIASRAGCRVIAVVGDEWKAARAREIGAAEAVVSRDGGFGKQILSLTGGRGVDVALDSVGAETWPAVIEVLATRGRLVACGATSGDVPQISIRTIYQRHRRIVGAPLGSIADAHALMRAVAGGLLDPVVHARVALDAIHDGLEALAARTVFGKIVVDIDANVHGQA